MVTRTFLDKCNTIVKDGKENFGLNPVVMLNHGLLTTRILLHFDETEILDKLNDGTYGYDCNIKHILKMTNCASIDDRTFNRLIPSSDKKGVKKRASSFTVLAFKLPKEWDQGVGFDYSSDVWLSGDGAVSFEGSTWYQAYNGNLWDSEGVYSDETLTEEYVKFSKGEESIIIDRQHFDYGNEDLELDITSYVNYLKGEHTHNHGIGLCFTPMLEESAITMTQYVGFFSNHTNTFFEPYIETRTDSVVNDDRNAFYLNKTNKLYLYAHIGGELVNLDEMPTCTIEGSEMAVKQQKKGIYYAEVKLSSKEHSKDEIISDIWSNIIYDGDELEDVEQEFVTLAPENYFSMSPSITSRTNYTAVINGINDGEHIISEDTRLINVIFRKKYSSDYDVLKNQQYRLYVKNGNKEVDVISWDSIDSTNESNYFFLEIGTLIPNEYHIDIKVKIGQETKIFKDTVKFTIENNSTNIKK